MKAEIQSESPSRSSIALSVTAAEVAAARAAVAKEYAAQATIPGFRPGKAPVAVVERKFSARIAAAATERAVRDAFNQAVRENGLKLWEIVSMDEPVAGADGSLTAKAVVDLEPAFELPALDGIPVDDADTKVTDENVEEQFESIRRSAGSFGDLAPDAPLEADDMTQLEYVGTVDGKPLDEVVPEASAFAKNEKAWCTVGSDFFVIPGIAAALVGKKVGEKCSEDVTFPADFYLEPLRGVSVHYEFTPKSARKFILPELDEAFFKGLGVADGDELRKRIREGMERQAQNADRTRRVNQIANHLAHAVSFDPPQAEWDRLSERILSDLLRMNMDKGVAKEDLSKERERLMDAARAQAADRLRSDFVLDAVVRERKIELSDAEFNAYLNAVVRRQGLSEDQIRKLAKDNRALRAHHTAALREKALSALLEKAAPTASFKA